MISPAYGLNKFKLWAQPIDILEMEIVPDKNTTQGSHPVLAQISMIFSSLQHDRIDSHRD